MFLPLIAAVLLHLLQASTLETQTIPMPILPEINSFWDFNNPAESEIRFAEAVAQGEAHGDVQYQAEALTQLARSQGLQRRFEDAHATLDRVEKLIGNEPGRVRVRLLLERGRALNSSGKREESRPVFDAALKMGEQLGEENLAVDAAHMLGIVYDGDESLKWNERALAMAEAAKDPRAQKWKGSLYNNIGWTYFDLKRYDDALAMFEKAVVFRKEQGDPQTYRIARWCVAKTWRVQGRVEEALAEQKVLLKEYQDAGQKDAFVFEEIAECLYTLGKTEEAKPYFAKAHEVLSKDPWIAEGEPKRVERLKELSRS